MGERRDGLSSGRERAIFREKETSMKDHRTLRILAAAAVAGIALSLANCIIIPRHLSNSDSEPDSGKTSVQILTPGRNDDLKPAPLPRVAYRVGETISVTGTMRHDWGGYYIDDDLSSAIFRFVGNKVSEADTFQKNLNRKIQVRLKILSADGQVFQADFISFGG
jgi:hypothetical protein